MHKFIIIYIEYHEYYSWHIFLDDGGEFDPFARHHPASRAATERAFELRRRVFTRGKKSVVIIAIVIRGNGVGTTRAATSRIPTRLHPCSPHPPPRPAFAPPR